MQILRASRLSRPWFGQIPRDVVAAPSVVPVFVYSYRRRRVHT